MMSEQLSIPRTSIQDFMLFSAGLHDVVRPTRTKEEHMVCAALGICGELDEVADATGSTHHTMLEVGDVLSYAACLSNKVELSFDRWMREEHLDRSYELQGFWHRSTIVGGALAQSTRFGLRLAELIKKHVFQSRKLDTNQVDGALIGLVQELLAYAGSRGLTPRQVMDGNVRKLCRRYPFAAGHVVDQLWPGVEPPDVYAEVRRRRQFSVIKPEVAST